MLEYKKRTKKSTAVTRFQSSNRQGSATLEEIMVLAAVLPAVALSFFIGVRIVRAIYSVIAILVSWPAL